MTRIADPLPPCGCGDRVVIDPISGCWIWQGTKVGAGYGTATPKTLATETRLVHKAHYERINGPVPDGFELDHRCKNKACVNPFHLEVVTHRENVHRGRSTKLTAEDRAAVKASTEVSAAVASEFGISAGAVRKLRGPLRDKGIMRKGVR